MTEETKNHPSSAEVASEEFGRSGIQITPGDTGKARVATPSVPLIEASPAMLVREAVAAFLSTQPLESPESVEPKLLHAINARIEACNAERKAAKQKPFATYSRLPREAVAAVMTALYIVRKVLPPRSTDRGMLAFYRDSGANAGIFVGKPDVLRALVRGLLPGATVREANDVLDLLREADEDLVPSVNVCDDRDLVPVDNGIFDYRTKELLPFSADLVFTSKLRTKYVDDPENPMFTEADGATWDVESWVVEMANGDPEWANACWHVIGASVRPNVRWDKAVFFYDEDGETGKGTLVKLMRSLHGDDSCSNLPISDFSADRRFRHAELEGKTLNACDENAVGDFNDDLAAFKAVITGDVILVERKMEQPYPLQVSPFMVQCINGHMRSKDASASARRRQYYLPFTKSYTGRANKRIKADYVSDQRVLEYVLHKVLNMPDFYELPTLAAGDRAALDARANNDPVFRFWGELGDEFVWDLLPTAFLYDLFTSWSRRFNPSGKPLGSMDFSKRLASLARDLDEWDLSEDQVRPGRRMDAPELLIYEYDLREWKNPTYTGSDPAKVCTPLLKAKYRGLVRVSTQPQPSPLALSTPGAVGPIPATKTT